MAYKHEVRSTLGNACASLPPCRFRTFDCLSERVAASVASQTYTYIHTDIFVYLCMYVCCADTHSSLQSVRTFQPPQTTSAFVISPVFAPLAFRFPRPSELVPFSSSLYRFPHQPFLRPGHACVVVSFSLSNSHPLLSTGRLSPVCSTFSCIF